MSDYSEAELAALEIAFPEVRVYLCDFHREQSWTRSVPFRSRKPTHPSPCLCMGTSTWWWCSQHIQTCCEWPKRVWSVEKPHRCEAVAIYNVVKFSRGTNNGTEAQNKLFKDSFLPRKKQKATLSSTISIIVENYLPSVASKLPAIVSLSFIQKLYTIIPPWSPSVCHPPLPG